MNLKFSISGKLYLSFGIVMILMLVTSILTFYNLSKNTIINTRLSEVYAPSISNLNKLNGMIMNSKMLIKNWVYIDKQSDTEDKIKLKSIQEKEFAAFINDFDPLVAQWEDQALKKA
jgi:methyl-accepting chemotaxis protein